ncbi:MAG: hypothetical protein ACE5HS_21905 [bacterium]
MQKRSLLILSVICILALVVLTLSIAKEKKFFNWTKSKSHLRTELQSSASVKTPAIEKDPVKRMQYRQVQTSTTTAKERKVLVSKELKIKSLNKK